MRDGGRSEQLTGHPTPVSPATGLYLSGRLGTDPLVSTGLHSPPPLHRGEQLRRLTSLPTTRPCRLVYHPPPYSGLPREIRCQRASPNSSWGRAASQLRKGHLRAPPHPTGRASGGISSVPLGTILATHTISKSRKP